MNPPFVGQVDCALLFEPSIDLGRQEVRAWVVIPPGVRALHVRGFRSSTCAPRIASMAPRSPRAVAHGLRATIWDC
jgi:hypothetical protein